MRLSIATFSGTSGGWTSAVVPLPVAALGQSIRLEFFLFSDAVEGAPGWYIDEVEVR